MLRLLHSRPSATKFPKQALATATWKPRTKSTRNRRSLPERGGADPAVH